LRSFQSRIDEFEKRGLRVVAISVDPPSINHNHRQKVGLTFPLLSDEKADTIRRYDLLHPKGGPGGADISRPAEFLVDSSGTIRWENLTESVTVRARPGQVLDAFDHMATGATASR
jgi:peroxiredoxin